MLATHSWQPPPHPADLECCSYSEMGANTGPIEANSSIRLEQLLRIRDNSQTWEDIIMHSVKSFTRPRDGLQKTQHGLAEDMNSALWAHGCRRSFELYMRTQLANDLTSASWGLELGN